MSRDCSQVNNIRELNWLKMRSTHHNILLGVNLNNKSKIRLWTLSNAHSAKCYLRPRARSRDLWTSWSWSWNQGYRSRVDWRTSRSQNHGSWSRSVRPRTHPW